MSITAKAPFTIRKGMVRVEGPWCWQCSLCWAKGGTQTRGAAELRAHAHVMNVHPPCPKCDEPLDVNGDCKGNCDYGMPSAPPQRVTSRNRFGGRNHR